MDLSSPVPQSRKFVGEYLLVIAGGLATSSLALAGVYWINVHAEENIMGWYADYVLPAGAIVVGLVASSGYALASWLRGIRITPKLLIAIVVLQIAIYFIAQYIEFYSQHLVYQETGEPVAFTTYFDAVTRAFAWKDKDGGGPGEAFGVWGYAMRLLEIIGFCGGSLLAPLALRNRAYCSDCAAYMKTRIKAELPASVAVRKIKKKDTEGQAAYDAEQQAAYQAAHETTAALLQQAQEGNARAFKDILAPHLASAKGARKLPVRLRVSLCECAFCRKGELALNELTLNGNKVQSRSLGRLPLRAQFVLEAQ